jgi:tripartite-type tricarboxylate transporter receptor subunit TctC
MKKLLFMMLVVFALVVAGCSGANQRSSNQDGGNNEKEERGGEKKNFPEKPITLISPYAPGGSTDTTARIISQGAMKYLPNKQEIVIENVPGGGSTIGVTKTFQSKPDGYTIGIVSDTALAIKLHETDLPYKWDSFDEIMRMVSIPQIMFVQKDAPWNTFDEWLEYVIANPGKFKYSVAGSGTIGHLAMEELDEKAGIDTVAVPYDGGGPAMQALLGGHVDGSITFGGNGDLAQVKMLFNSAFERSGLFDVPTLTESGVESGNDPFVGLVAPPGVPEGIKTIIHDAFKKSLEDPEVIEKLKQQGLEPYYAGPDEFEEIIGKTYESYGEIMKSMGLAK